jgi:hypothetical protein
MYIKQSGCVKRKTLRVEGGFENNQEMVFVKIPFIEALCIETFRVVLAHPGAVVPRDFILEKKSWGGKYLV